MHLADTFFSFQSGSRLQKQFGYQHSLEQIILCSIEERKTYRFDMT